MYDQQMYKYIFVDGRNAYHSFGMDAINPYDWQTEYKLADAWEDGLYSAFNDDIKNKAKP